MKNIINKLYNFLYTANTKFTKIFSNKESSDLKNLSATNWDRKSLSDFGDFIALAGQEPAMQSSGLMAIDSDNRITFANRTLRSLIPSLPHKIIGKNILELNLPQNTFSVLHELCKQARLKQDNQYQEPCREIKISGSSQPTRYLSVKASPSAVKHLHSLNSGPESLILTFKDISSRRSIEPERVQEQRMATIAKNIGGLVHDLNNHLTGVCGLISILKNRQEINDPNNFLEQALNSANQAAAVLNQLMQYTNTTAKQGELVHATELKQASYSLIKQALGPMGELNFETDQNISFQADKNLIIQALVNLATISGTTYRTEHTKKLEICIGHELLDESITNLIPGAYPGNFVRIIIRDYGMSHSASAIRNAFSSLDGSSPSERSTFDLSTVYSIIRGHDGFMSLESLPNKGNLVTLYLPEYSKAKINLPATKQPEVKCADIQQGQGQQLLVVEDNLQVQTVLAKMLEGLGYKVETCSNGAEALLLCQQKEFDLVIADMMMPIMGGQELIEQIDPSKKKKVLLVTGYGLSMDENFVNTAILAKPFDLSTLANKVQHLLNQ